MLSALTVTFIESALASDVKQTNTAKIPLITYVNFAYWMGEYFKILSTRLANYYS